MVYTTLKNNVNYKYFKRLSGKYLDPICFKCLDNLQYWIMRFFTISSLSAYNKQIKEFTMV
jgi:hypothetical protein